MTMWFPIVLALVLQLAAAEFCPGGKTSCSQGMTCCELPSGEEGCCPYSNATCCADKVHCCPHGFSCSSGHCHRESEGIYTELTKLMVNYQDPSNNLDDEDNYMSRNASFMAPANELCPDRSQCRDTQTCCQLEDRSYGCCPFSEGVCCSDKKTCCPTQHVCLEGGWCKPQDDDSARNIMAEQINTICPGGRQTCPAGDTCCPRARGQYGCCPLLAATCCSDQQHCCPHGYRCSGIGYCTKSNGED